MYHIPYVGLMTKVEIQTSIKQLSNFRYWSCSNAKDRSSTEASKGKQHEISKLKDV